MFISPVSAVSLVSSVTIVQLACSVCGALGEIARGGPLPLPDKPGEGEEEGEEDVLFKTSVVDCLTRKLRSAKEIKVTV